MVVVYFRLKSALFSVLLVGFLNEFVSLANGRLGPFLEVCPYSVPHILPFRRRSTLRSHCLFLLNSFGFCLKFMLFLSPLGVLGIHFLEELACRFRGHLLLHIFDARR